MSANSFSLECSFSLCVLVDGVGTAVEQGASCPVSPVYFLAETSLSKMRLETYYTYIILDIDLIVNQKFMRIARN